MRNIILLIATFLFCSFSYGQEQEEERSWSLITSASTHFQRNSNPNPLNAIIGIGGTVNMGLQWENLSISGELSHSLMRNGDNFTYTENLLGVNAQYNFSVGDSSKCTFLFGSITGGYSKKGNFETSHPIPNYLETRNDKLFATPRAGVYILPPTNKISFYISMGYQMPIQNIKESSFVLSLGIQACF